jgi:hypothetical protein
MTDETEQTAEVEESPEVQTEAETKSTDWVAEARKWENRAKAWKADSEKLKQLEDSQKTAEEKRLEQLTSMQKELEQERTERMRLQVATELGITGEAVRLITGGNEDEIRERAELVRQLVEERQKPRSPQAIEAQGRESNRSVTTSDSFSTILDNLL